MVRSLKIFLFFILSFTLHNAVKAQDMRVSAVLDTSKIRIGEPVKLDLYFLYNPNQGSFKIQWPTIGDTITEKIEVISHTEIDTTMPDKSDPNLIQQHQQFIISAYDSGYFAIPPFKFVLNGDTANPKLTEALLLEVHTVPTDSSATKLKDIKEPFGEPFNWMWYKEYFYWGIAGLVFVIALFLIIYYRNKRLKNKIIEPEKPKIPAHITALASLERIKNEQIWKDNKIKEYYSDITDAVRLYIEERYNVSALESTTDELLTLMRSQVIDQNSKEKLKQILVLSDFVKFAKMIPLEQEHVITLTHAFDFVNGTKREEEITLVEDEPKEENKNV
jgi:hypothetical protein